MKIVLIKLINGEQVMGELVNSDQVLDKSEQSLELKRPRTLLLAPTQQGLALMFQDFIIGLDDKATVRLPLNQILTFVFDHNLKKELIAQYIQATTNLAVASNIPNQPGLINKN